MSCASSGALACTSTSDAWLSRKELGVIVQGGAEAMGERWHSTRWRAVLVGIAGIATASSRAAGQPADMPVIGFLSSRSEEDSKYVHAAFLKGLNEGGFSVGRNITILYRWAQGQYDKLPALAADLVERRVVVLVAVGGEPSALAAKAATSTIPIVFTSGGDPVKIGLVASLNRPGGNATGYSLMTTAPEAKRLTIAERPRSVTERHRRLDRPGLPGSG
jgi:putative tryptophan/tyrosine transport system substrate-binding protein